MVAKLFLSNRSQAVRIPANLRLHEMVKDVEVCAWGRETEIKEGTNRILETIGGLSG
jgi:virulence-associated protein VagC